MLSLKPLQVYIQILLTQNEYEQAMQQFDKCLQILELHFGESHPLHSTLYCILAFYHLEMGNLEDSRYLYKSALIASLRMLGQSHPQTG